MIIIEYSKFPRFTRILSLTEFFNLFKIFSKYVGRPSYYTYNNIYIIFHDIFYCLFLQGSRNRILCKLQTLFSSF